MVDMTRYSGQNKNFMKSLRDICVICDVFTVALFPFHFVYVASGFEQTTLANLATLYVVLVTQFLLIIVIVINTRFVADKNEEVRRYAGTTMMLSSVPIVLYFLLGMGVVLQFFY